MYSRLFSRWWAAGLAVLSIGLYTVLVGAQPPVVRAAMMGSLGLLGRCSAGASPACPG
jgi:predicted membrane metal-binding protein